MVDWKARRDPIALDDGRDDFDRDYARIIHSASFRRLQSKTQVLGLGDSDFYRTRLTHSLEVSQIGEGIARDLQNKYGKELGEDLFPGSSLIRSVCLAHDLGHPPFGHGGEVALNRCMRNHGGFEGNGQTLRILTQLESYHPDFGMNLTRRTILGILKYPSPYSKSVNVNFYPNDDSEALNPLFNSKSQKPPKCYLDNEEKFVNEWLAAEFSSEDWSKFTETFSENEQDKNGNVVEKHRKTKYKSLDTSIMEIADDIAYGIHDLEDAIALNFLSRDNFVKNICESDFECFKKSPKGMNFDELINSLFSQSTHLRKKAIGALVNFCIISVDLDKTNSSLFSERNLGLNAKMGPSAAKMRENLHKLVEKFVIKSTAVQNLEFKGQKIITDLFNAFMTDPERLLPNSDRQRLEKAGSEGDRARVICDYIAGMTDEYAAKRYQQLFLPKVGSAFDKI
ncbi:anti-phage deoxyguanosine triphosphatase [Roseomonas sp. USHLN139]|uniref:anti-phage deoxyguanosine triphosphatase n=1 Tax=Roseomonas sp. USHLN139 TaxID=3081298 RepID=UPI003B0203CE